jgi:hypothetical protein
LFMYFSIQDEALTFYHFSLSLTLLTEKEDALPSCKSCSAKWS